MLIGLFIRVCYRLGLDNTQTKAFDKTQDTTVISRINSTDNVDSRRENSRSHFGCKV